MRTTLITIVVICSSVSFAHGHIELLEPMPRYPIEVAMDNKACPCGVGLSNRLCNVEGDRSDPDRAEDRVTTLIAGSTVRFRFDEYVGHAGRFRVAIDFDGADLDDFNANILVDVPDPPGNTGNVGDLSLWEIDVPLPDTPCDRCTLQLLQMMDGNTTDPVPDPVGRSSYYTCADVVLVADNGGADAGVAVDANTDTGADSGTDVDARPGDGNGGDDGDGGGCQIGGSSEPSWGALAALGMLLVIRRRQHEPAGLDRG